MEGQRLSLRVYIAAHGKAEYYSWQGKISTQCHYDMWLPDCAVLAYFEFQLKVHLYISWHHKHCAWWVLCAFLSIVSLKWTVWTFRVKCIAGVWHSCCRRVLYELTTHCSTYVVVVVVIAEEEERQIRLIWGHSAKSL